MKSRHLTLGVLTVALALSFAAAVRDRLALVEARAEITTLQAEKNRLRIHQWAWMKSLEEIEWTEPFLAAETLVGQASTNSIPLVEPRNVVLYLLSTNCPACSTNLPLLNELTGQGVPVFGLAVDSVTADVVDYHQTADLRFPVLVRANGSAVEAIPWYGTPTVLVISDAKVAMMEFGELSEASSETLKAITGAWGEG